MNIQLRSELAKDLQPYVMRSRDVGAQLAVLVIEIFRFRDISNVFGIDAGDDLVAQVTDRLRTIVKEDDLLARLGNEEFALVLPTLKNAAFATLAANKILSLMEEPFYICGQRIKVNVFIGISLYAADSVYATRLLQEADLALAQAKAANTSYASYTKSSDRRSSSEVVIENAIDKGLDNDEFKLFYQPKIDLKRGRTQGAEALIRWCHPERGMISPSEFIPITENTTLILPLTRWVINTAMRHYERFRKLAKAFSISINLSANILHSDELIDLVTQATRIWGVEPSRFVLEVTESATMRDPQRSLEVLRKFHEQGFGISIDDFGTGHSALAYLSKLPVAELKIDRSFVMNMIDNVEDEMIVRSIIDMAHNFNLSVTAEGVEDDDSLRQLTAMGCDSAQGFYMAKPMPVDDFITWSKSSKWGVDKTG